MRHHTLQAIEGNRLADKIEGAQLQCLNRGLHAPVGGHHRYRELRVTLLNVGNQFESITVWELHISEAQIGQFFFQGGFGLAERRGRHGVQFHPPQRYLQQGQQVRFIIDQEYARTGHEV